MYRGLDSRASGKNRKGKSMGKSLLVSNVLPAEALALIPKEISVDYHDSKDVLPRPELIARLRGKDGLICHIVSAIDDEVLAAAPTVKVVANVAVGYNNIDVEAARRRGVVVTNTPDVLTETTADFAWALLMASARRVVEADRFVRSGQWDRWLWDLLWGVDVYGKTLGIVGFGRIGRAVARRALGFNMRVLYQDAVQADAAAERDLRASRVELETLLRESDFVSLHTPFLQETRHLMKRAYAAPHEAVGDPRERGARAGCRRSRAGPGPSRGLDRRRRARRVRGGAEGPSRARPPDERRAGAAHRERIARHARRDGDARRPQLPGGPGRQDPPHPRAVSDGQA
jgi:hypothetical protein